MYSRTFDLKSIPSSIKLNETTSVVDQFKLDQFVYKLYLNNNVPTFNAHIQL